ncbi:hypothetical protein F4055_14150 [Candidatus Poribacteria bacterium]|nr:hypothetical protein [Candidatus Poribacteria bacterium]
MENCLKQDLQDDWDLHEEGRIGCCTANFSLRDEMHNLKIVLQRYQVARLGTSPAGEKTLSV